MGVNHMPKKKRTFRQMFMDKLKELSRDEQKLVGNTTLREKLGWDNERYTRIKKELLEDNTIIVGRGQGGTVGFANAPGTKDALNVSVSYSHRDEAIKNELVKHLEPLRRLNLIEAWHDRKLKAGEEFDTVISNALDKSDIILLLISIDFINSEYCYGIELDRALDRHVSQRAGLSQSSYVHASGHTPVLQSSKRCQKTPKQLAAGATKTKPLPMLRRELS